ncbi:hypothetical protein MTR62_01005 [Novosphingobium sp. 1949]|uniref:Uncharacterized protein n=1 Tax=Novosphingobium organovorum TaxID=2930092 RepID=A0ABT0B8C8_9SPHN|nr:hypothetical protein [Novosphingobium organovorum]MCJ2181292.1 hypothetical protein [Novosphingobium organovorum]
MLAEVTIDGVEAEGLRAAIEDMVRREHADEAAGALREKLAPLCAANAPLPAAFLQVAAPDVDFVGWNLLADAVWKLDQCGEPVAAIGFEMSPEERDEAGEPRLATRFFFDTAWPFSESSHTELLEAYDEFGTAWDNEHADTDETLVALDGLAGMAGALDALRNQAQRHSDIVVAQAEFLGTLYLAVLFHIAVRDRALREGLGRPMAFLAGTRGVVLALNAPALAAGAAQTSRKTAQTASAPAIPSAFEPAEAPELPLSQFESGPEGGFTPPDSPEEAAPNAPGLAALIASASDPDPGDDPEGWHLPPPGIHTTGTQLRRRLVTEESIAELEETGRTSLLSRLFRRR